MLEHHVVTEFLGGVSFSRNEENDVAIAEQIANYSYPTMEDLVRNVEGMIEHRKKAFKEYVEYCKTSPFFSKYFTNEDHSQDN